MIRGLMTEGESDMWCRAAGRNGRGHSAIAFSSHVWYTLPHTKISALTGTPDEIRDIYGRFCEL